jgi:hypothetical protein
MRHNDERDGLIPADSPSGCAALIVLAVLAFGAAVAVFGGRVSW